MSNENSPPSSPSSPTNRRASFSGKLTELFGRSPPTSNGTPAYPGAMSTANAQAQQRRRTSIASLAMAGSPTQSSPFANMRNRQSSMGSSNSPTSSVNESAIEEGDAEPNHPPASPMARRTSFGVNALREIKTQNGNANGRASINMAATPSAKGRGEGYNWSEQIKHRAERSASTTQALPPPTSASVSQQETTSVAAPEQPIREMPKTPQKPDHFQERILKGDFYMD
ncbi:hypothetical protein MMC21_004563 [Puttea exsequens]|nr:hypothetical protein [Puttea exsequens]